MTCGERGGSRSPAVANPLVADAGEVEGGAERAVELGDGRVGPAPEPVEVVGEAVAEVRLRSDVGGGADVVVPHRQPVGGREVEVGPHEDLVVRVPADDLAEAARYVVAVPGARDVDDALALGEPPEVDARRPVERVAHRRLPPLEVDVGEEEGAVPDEGAAGARPLLPVEEGRDGHVVDAAPDQPLVAAVEVGGAAEAVRAAAGDDVDAAPREAALAHVVGRHHELQLADRVEADRLGVGLAARRPLGGQPEQVVVDGAVDLDVVDGAVDLDVVVAAAPPGDAQEALGVGVAVGLDEERVGAGEVLEAALEGRQGLDDARLDAGRRAGPRRREHAARLGGDVHRLGDGGELQGDGDLGRLAEGNDDAGQRPCAEAAQGYLQVVGTDLRVQQVEPSVGAGERLVPGPGRGMDGDDARAGQHPQLGVANDAAERPGGGVLRPAGGGRSQRRGESERRGNPPRRKTNHLRHLLQRSYGEPYDVTVKGGCRVGKMWCGGEVPTPLDTETCAGMQVARPRGRWMRRAPGTEPEGRRSRGAAEPIAVQSSRSRRSMWRR